MDTLIESPQSDHVDLAVGERYSLFLNNFNSYCIYARLNKYYHHNGTAEDVSTMNSYHEISQSLETSQT